MFEHNSDVDLLFCNLPKGTAVNKKLKNHKKSSNVVYLDLTKPLEICFIYEV